MTNYDIPNFDTPYFILDEGLLTRNLEVLADVKARTGCKILLAQKAFSMYALYPLVSRYLDGTCASGLHEALLSQQYFGGENHVYSPAYSQHEFQRLNEICDVMVFNSAVQWRRFRHMRNVNKAYGIRINPELSTQQHEKPIYDPCAPNSRLGITLANFLAAFGDDADLEGISGLHFHTLCQQNSDALEATFAAVEGKFGQYLHKMDWINFGGGHHITRADYDVERLVSLIKRVQDTYNVQVYLEPGEAIALNVGFLVASVLDIVDNGMKIAILDTSAACHMPDVLEMPYRPHIIGSGQPGEKAHLYRLGGVSCLAGDVIGDYSFDAPLAIGDRLIFTDMAIYSMVKTTTFNGVPLPSIAVLRNDGNAELLKSFGYEDFASRL